MKQKRNLILLYCLFFAVVSAMGQAKKPTLMVVPADTWMNKHGYIKTFDNQGDEQKVPDYQKAVGEDSELMNVISQINNLMADRGFPLVDLSQMTKSVNNTRTEDQLLTSKSGSTVAESPVDALRRRARADIILELDWTVNTVGPKRSITYNLRGLDAYSNKQIAGAQGTGAQSFSAETPVLLEEAVQVHMDEFTARLQDHFEDMMTNGREVALTVRVWDGLGIDLETEYDGMELTEHIENWMNDNTVQHRYSTIDATENYIEFDQVRIPLYTPNGTTPMDTNRLARQLVSYLKDAPFNITCKVVNRGLGNCLIMLGEK